MTGVWVIRPSMMIYCDDDGYTKLLHLVIFVEFLNAYRHICWINKLSLILHIFARVYLYEE